MISCIFAMDEKRGIGLNGNLPWKNKKDMTAFKRITENNISIRKNPKLYKIKNSNPNSKRVAYGKMNLIKSITTSNTYNFIAKIRYEHVFIKVYIFYI